MRVIGISGDSPDNDEAYAVFMLYARFVSRVA